MDNTEIIQLIGEFKGKLDLIVEQTKSIPNMEKEIAVHNERIKKLENLVKYGGTIACTVICAFIIYIFKIG